MAPPETVAEPTSVHVRQPPPALTGFVLVVLGLALFFSNLGAHDLWSPDEVRYALVAREMRASGDYVLPHLNGGVYREKPPLMFWLTSACANAYGRLVEWRRGGPAQLDRPTYVNETTARLPSALAALCTLVLVWRAAARRWDEWTGLAAALILATNVQFFWFSRTGALDALLTLCVTVAILCGVRALDADRRWAPWVLGVAVALAAGVLTKGPVAFLIPALVVGPYGWMIGRGRRAAVVLGVAVIGALFAVAPWWRAAYVQSDGAFGNVQELLRQTSGRVIGSYSHRKPFYHYAVGIFGEFLPWSVFLPVALWSAVRARGSVEWPRLLLAWCWVVIPFLVFSAISGKRGQYLLPIYPGLAMLIAAYLRQYAGDLRPLTAVRALAWPTILLAGALMLAGIALVGLAAATLVGVYPAVGAEWLSSAAGEASFTGTAAAEALGGGIALLCLGAWALLHHVHRPPSRVIATIVALATLILAFGAGVVLPAFDQVKSARSFATMVRGLAGVNTRVVLFHSFRADIAYYYGRHLEVAAPTAMATADVDQPGPLLAIIQEKHYRRFRDQIPERFVLVHRERIGSRTWVLLTNRPPAI